MASGTDHDRLFVRDGWRHYRRTYSRAEMRWGLVVLAVLGGVVAWVMYRGANPDPELFAAPRLTGGAAEGGAADRGPLPEGLAAPGWTEGAPSKFDADNLYVKINGRADYFLSFGFQQLHFVTLSRDDITVDVEAYDLGDARNALGAFAGELGEGAEARALGAGLARIERNAAYLATGRYYVRAIGSEESAAVTEQLEHLERALAPALGGGELPWGYDLFVGAMAIDPAAVAYYKENAFSFGFARDVYAARLADETELFVVATDGADAAGALAGEFNDAFAKYGEPVDDSRWVADRYLGALSAAGAVDRIVIGVRGAPDREAGDAAFARLEQAVRDAPPALLERAVPASQPATEEPEPEPELEETYE